MPTPPVTPGQSIPAIPEQTSKPPSASPASSSTHVPSMPFRRRSSTSSEIEIRRKMAELKRASSSGTRENGILDLSGTSAPAAMKTSEGASSHAAVYVNDGTHDYRAKFNHHGAVPTFHEVLAARINKMVFGHAFSPEVKFGSNTAALERLGFSVQGRYTGVAIASRMVEGFKDWGDFLVGEKCREHVPPENRTKYDRLRGQYAHNRAKRESAKTALSRSSTEMATLLAAPKRDYRSVDKSLVQQLEPLRKLDAEALSLQDRMLGLLPPEFRASLIRALAETEAIGNWDYANHERANVGFVIRDGKLIGATVIDFGVCGLTGFSGRQKAQSRETIQLPARVDDPYLRMPLRKEGEMPPEPYMVGAVIDKSAVTDFTRVSPSCGLIASFPRSPAYAALMKEVIQGEREGARMPASLVETARRLSQVTQTDLYNLIQSVWSECRASDDSHVGAMLDAVEAQGQTAAALAGMYYARFSNILARAGISRPGEEKPVRPS